MPATTLDNQLLKLLEQGRALGVPDLADLPPAAAREVYRMLVTTHDAPAIDLPVEDRAIPGPGGELALRIYRPPGDVVPRGAVLYLHGGGFVVGCPNDYDGLARSLCAQSGCVLVLPDYRLAPEHPFPAAVEDAWAALAWLAANADEIGCVDADGQARIAVAGDSAGANLAAVCALLARDRGGPALCQQTLIYPVTVVDGARFESRRTYGEGLTLSTRSMHYFTSHYLGSEDFLNSDHVRDFRAAPLEAADLSGLAPALVLVAGFDPLRDEGVAYASALQTAGSDAVLIEYAGLAHGFINMSGAVEAARLAVAQVANAWRHALAAPGTGQ